MKTFFIATGAVVAMLSAAPAFAQSWMPNNMSYYGTLGYSNIGGDGSGGPDFGAITGRLGARYGKYLGLEGEASTGLNNDKSVHVENQYAGYAVGYLPVRPNADIFARVGYGATVFGSTTPAAIYHGQDDSWNYGGGAQYFFSEHNGVRVDYTRSDYDHGPDANTWGVSYVRKF